MTEHMQFQIQSDCRNVSFARVVVAAFLSRLDPTIEELEDVKTAVSEAVTNAIIHGYGDQPGIVTITCQIEGQQPVVPHTPETQTTILPETTAQTITDCQSIPPEITITIQDTGIGIADIRQAMEPMYTGRPDLERSGMGFSFMEAFMDSLQVDSALGAGTTVTMKKSFRKEA